MKNLIKLVLLTLLTVNAAASSYCVSWITRWSQKSTYEYGKSKHVCEQTMVKINYEDTPRYMTVTTEWYDDRLVYSDIHSRPFDIPVQNQDWTWISPDRNVRNTVTGRTKIKIKNLTNNTVFQRLYIFGNELLSNGQPTGMSYNSRPGFYIYPLQTMSSDSPWTSYENFSGGYYFLNDY